MKKIPEKTAAGRTRRRRWKIIGWGALGVVVLLGFLIFGTRRHYPIPLPDAAEVAATRDVLRKFSESLLTAKGEIADQSCVVLTPDEVNAILKTGLRAAQRKSKPGAPAFFVSWRDGGIQIQLSQPVGFLAVNPQLRIVPGLADGHLRLAVDSAWAGWLPLPGFLLQPLADGALANAERAPEYQGMIAIFESIRVTADGDLELRFFPRNIGEFIQFLVSR